MVCTLNGMGNSSPMPGANAKLFKLRLLMACQGANGDSARRTLGIVVGRHPKISGRGGIARRSLCVFVRSCQYCC